MKAPACNVSVSSSGRNAGMYKGLPLGSVFVELSGHGSDVVHIRHYLAVAAALSVE